MSDRDLVTFPTWERYSVIAHVVFNLSVRERRIIFQLARTTRADVLGDVFFPAFGISLSEFAVWYTLGDTRKRAARPPAKTVAVSRAAGAAVESGKKKQGPSCQRKTESSLAGDYDHHAR